MFGKFAFALSMTVLAIGICASPLSAQNVAAASLDEQLRAQYKLAKIGTADGNINVLEPGTVLDIEKGGIVGSVPHNMIICPSKYEAGDLKKTSGMCLAMLGQQNLRYLPSGEKVYPFKLEVNPAKEKISIMIIECDACNGVNGQSSYRSQVVFQFAKGYLETASVPQVEDNISQVLAIDQGGDQAQQTQNPGPQNQPVDQSPEPPVTVQLGQTSDQVIAALGQPGKIVNLGAKQIYIYKDLKVTFENGKVKDVQ